MKTLFVRFVIVILAFVSVGCDAVRGLAEFHVSVSNRLSNTITVYANGMDIGAVGPGRADAFILKLKIVSGGFTGPTSSARATFAARDVVTGKLSREKPMILYEDQPLNVEFNPYDFQ
jgi:hypothetical protein